jgi:hypothetical protein
VRGLPVLRPLPVLGTIGSHAFRAGRSLPDSRVLDRLMRGRAWIVLIGMLLIGLVALNVSLLKLNAEAGRNAEKVKDLRIQNTQLRARVSRLASAERLERTGRDLGLAMSIAGRVRYLSVRPSDGRKAARAIRTWETLPTFAFAPLPLPPPPSVTAETQAPVPAAGATGATGPAGVPAATGVPTGAPATGVPTTQTTTPGTATTPATGTSGQAPVTTTPTQPEAGGQALTGPTG